jgi:hypothetical protein
VSEVQFKAVEKINFLADRLECSAHFLCHAPAVVVAWPSEKPLATPGLPTFYLRILMCQRHVDDYDGYNAQLERKMRIGIRNQQILGLRAQINALDKLNAVDNGN